MVLNDVGANLVFARKTVNTNALGARERTARTSNRKCRATSLFKREASDMQLEPRTKVELLSTDMAYAPTTLDMNAPKPALSEQW